VMVSTFPVLYICCALMDFSTGNVHVVFFCPQDEKEIGDELIKDVQKRALRMEGTITGEHGIGLSLRTMLVEEVGSADVDMMRNVCIQTSSCVETTNQEAIQIKLSLDPKGILNPEKVFKIRA
jgi:D-lactate dehydrogenase (cytochrome)